MNMYAVGQLSDMAARWSRPGPSDPTRHGTATFRIPGIHVHFAWRGGKVAPSTLFRVCRDGEKWVSRNGPAVTAQAGVNGGSIGEGAPAGPGEECRVILQSIRRCKRVAGCARNLQRPQVSCLPPAHAGSNYYAGSVRP